MTAAKNRRGVAYSIVAILLLLLFCFAGYSVYRFKTSDVALRKKLVGTWIGSGTEKMEFRADGTARSFAIDGDPPMDYEWVAYGSTLQIYTVTKKLRLRSMIGRYVLGEYGLGGKIEDISEDQLKVFFYAAGERVTLKRVSEAP